MIVKRQHIFETNSSSVHNMIIATDEESKLLDSGDILIDCNCMISKEDAIKKFNKLKEDHPERIKDTDNYKTYLDIETLEEWINSIYEDCLEYEYYDYTTKGGEHINMYIRHGEDR